MPIVFPEFTLFLFTLPFEAIEITEEQEYIDYFIWSLN